RSTATSNSCWRSRSSGPSRGSTAAAAEGRSAAHRPQIAEDYPRHGLERLEDSAPDRRAGLEVGQLARVEQPAHLGERRGVRQVALVVLDHGRELVEVVALVGEVDAQVVEALDVGLHALDLAVGDEDHAVHALQDQLAARVVEDLTGNGVEVEAGLEA